LTKILKLTKGNLELFHPLVFRILCTFYEACLQYAVALYFLIPEMCHYFILKNKVFIA